jgi:hypothetical protein
VSEDEIVVGNWCMATEAFLNEAGILAVRLVIFADETGGESPPPVFLYFPEFLTINSTCVNVAGTSATGNFGCLTVFLATLAKMVPSGKGRILLRKAHMAV